MMDPGETSRKKSNEDETDRPLKKAKYLWQVKGKYHLKDNQPSGNTSSSMGETKIETKTKTIPIANSKNKNKNKNKNKSVCSDRSCIEAVLANSDKFMEFSLIDSPPSSRKNIDKSISDEIPITLVKATPKTDDHYLRKWQVRQIAKGFLDNTINRVLEHWMMVTPFDAADFVESCDDNGGQIEDEGILMAIQSHGLQSAIGQRPSLYHCNPRNNWDAQANCTCAKTPATPAIQRETLTPFHQRIEHNLSDLHYYEDDKAPPAPTAPPAPPILPAVAMKTNASSYEPLKMNDTDFLDAAVAVAIQKKGLTSLNCVDCG